MRRLHLMLFLIPVLAVAVACDWPWATGPTQVVTVSVVQQPGSGSSPVPSPSACPAPAFARVSGPSEMRANEVRGLDLTPFLAAGVQSPASCDAARAVSWDVEGPCSIEGAGYNPNLRASAPGVCEVSARVDGVRSDVLTVRVVP